MWLWLSRVFVFHKAGGSWSKGPTTALNAPPTFQYASRTRPARAFLLLSARKRRFCLFLSGKRRNYSPPTRDVWRRQHGERGRSVIITTTTPRRALSPLYNPPPTRKHETRPLWRPTPLAHEDNAVYPMSQTLLYHQRLPSAMPMMTTTHSCSSPTTRSRQSPPRLTSWTTSTSRNDAAYHPSIVCLPNCSSPSSVGSHQQKTSCRACLCPRIGLGTASPYYGTAHKQTIGPASTASSDQYARQNASSHIRIWSNVSTFPLLLLRSAMAP